MHLGEGRLRDLVTQARRVERFIVCHDTLPHHKYPQVKPAICRGFADRYSTQALQVIERLFGFIEVDPPGEDVNAADNTAPTRDTAGTAQPDAAD
ncbi:hypothetical protein Pen02_18740 [Plantactinospora endophytica]|uniref:Uncharacterized protein n=2 Tax=Plantactinospora endophytica TaxID=673535 RepID=A0ABQ4DWU6_9ACTN|nr:hypothetical protein Pen02_18740 [Plantactinospora endophytica]